MWIVTTEIPYETWIEVFDTKEEAMKTFNEEVSYYSEIEELTDESMRVNERVMHIAKVENTFENMY